jgi:predicted nucleic-acid-binding protein
VRAVDTNVLVRLIVRDDARQTKAAEAFVQPGAWIPHLVLVETIWVLGSFYKLTPAQLADAVEMLLNHRDLMIENAGVVTRALVQFQKHPGVGFSDCLIVEVARQAGHVPLGTFDRELAKLDGVEQLNR